MGRRDKALTADQNKKPAGRWGERVGHVDPGLPTGTVRPLTGPEYRLAWRPSSYFSYKLTET
jgi:hypothetical protein